MTRHPMNCLCKFCSTQVNKEFTPVSAGITLEDLVASFTEPGKQFQFPIEGIPITLTQDTKSTVILGLGLMGVTTGIVVGIINNMSK